MYENIRSFDTAKIKEIGDPERYFVEYVSESALNWSMVDNINEYVPLNSGTAELIRKNQLDGREVYIYKNWTNSGSKEVLPIHLQVNALTDLSGYKRRAMSYLKRYIHPMMANVNAAVIYGFTVLNNKFLEAGFVFSEENKSLKYIEIMEKADKLEEEDKIEASEDLMNQLEKYIEYKDTLSRSYFAWDLSEEYIKKIEDVKISGNSYHLLLSDKEVIDNPEFDMTTLVKLAYSKKCPLFVINGKEYLVYPNKYSDNLDTIEAFKSLPNQKEKLEFLNMELYKEAKEKVDTIVKEYITKVNTLNNLK